MEKDFKTEYRCEIEYRDEQIKELRDALAELKER